MIFLNFLRPFLTRLLLYVAEFRGGPSPEVLPLYVAEFRGDPSPEVHPLYVAGFRGGSCRNI